MSRGKILVAERDMVLRDELVDGLESAGYEVRAVPSAQDASDVVLRFRPDLILLDMDAPYYSGPDFHKCLQVTPRGRRIPVVYLSSKRTWIQQEIAEEQEAAALILRPCPMQEILSTVADVLHEPAPAVRALVLA